MSVTDGSGAKPARRRSVGKIWQWYFAICLLAGGALGLSSGMGVVMPVLPAPLVLALSAAVVALALTVSVAWMRGIDELAQRAHYVAWFWGGGAGLCALVFLLLSAPALQQLVDFKAIERALAPTVGDGAGFTLGVMTSLLVLMIGYGCWWLVFWLRKR